jgi:predicted TIM-barrel fold metal-dependent hydrolase
MLIDIHTHCSFKSGLTRANGSQYPEPEELISALDSAGIDRAVVLSTVSPECRYVLVPPEHTLAIASEYPDRLIPFCCVDPRFLTFSTEADFTEYLEYYKALGCRGVGEYIANLPLDHDLNMNAFSYVEKAGLPLTFHLAAKTGGGYGCVDELGLPRLEHVLKSYPELTFLGHSQVFWAEIGADADEENREGYPGGEVEPGRLVELMRAYPNLHGDLSAGSGYNAISRDREYGYAFLSEFQDRLYFGTDIANVPQDLPIVDYFARLAEEKAVETDVLEKIKWRNADRLLQLGIAEATV